MLGTFASDAVTNREGLNNIQLPIEGQMQHPMTSKTTFQLI
jgi:hypothetical protein